MTPGEIEVKINFLSREIQYWRGILANKSCRSCEHFDNGYSCGLTNGVAPPPEVQKTGCPQWAWDQIPF